LREVVSASKNFNAALKVASGDPVLDDVPPGVWAKFSNAMDVDTAKLMFLQVTRWLTAELVHKEEGIGAMVGDILQLLEALNLD